MYQETMSREKFQKLEVDERRAESVNSNDQPEIFKLNNVCLINIFSFLPIPERIRIQRVCKRWQEAGNLCWCDIKRLKIGHKNYGFFNESLKCDKIDLQIVKQVLRLCGPCLSHIELNDIDSSLDHSVSINQAFLAIVKTMCPNLKSIDFGFSLCRRTMRFIANNFDNLKQCTLRHGYTNLEDILPIFLLKNKNLEYFRLISCSTKGSCMLNLCTERIKHIEINNCTQFLAENLSQVLQNVHTLETLKIADSKRITAKLDMILKSSPEQPNLKSLTILSEYSRFVSSRKAVHISYMHKFTNLETLELRGGDVLHDEVLLNVAQHCMSLQRAVLAASNRVKDSGLQQLTLLPKLNHLKLNYLPWVTKKIVPYLLKLKTFECKQCQRLDDRSFRRLIEMSKNLEYLDVDDHYFSRILSTQYEIEKRRVSSNTLKLCVEGEIIKF